MLRQSVFLSCLLASVFSNAPLLQAETQDGQIELNQPVQLNSSVLVLDRVSLLNASAYVNRIADLGENRLMVVISMQCRLDGEFKPFCFGLMKDRSQSWAAPQNFEPMTGALLAEYRDLLRKVFTTVEKRGLDLAIMLHLDPAGEINEWRNYYDFDPQESIRGYSYKDLLIDSCIKAIESELSPDRQISFSISGEMGRSIAKYPHSYRFLVDQMREQLVDRKLKIGISLNHNELFAKEQLTIQDRFEIQELIDQLDFIGLSHYRPFNPPARRRDFQHVIEEFVAQLQQEGLQLKPQMTLHFSEIGIGGAPNQLGKSTPERAAAMPWEGTGNPAANPWNSDSMRKFRREYYEKLLEFLKNPQSCYHLAEAFLWSESSWDPIGVTNSWFMDPEIKKAVLSHNRLSIKER